MPSGVYQHKKGWKHSEETKRKMRKKHRPFSEYTKRKMSESKRGDKHPNWKDGSSRVYRTGYWSKEYREWRMKVFLRDNFTCQFCEARSHVGLGKTIYLEAHHLKSFAKYPKLRFEVDNGITLCDECHKLAHKNK